MDSENIRNTIDDAANDIKSACNSVENDFARTEQDIHDAFSNGSTGGGTKLKTDRSLLAYVLLGLITCGIYDWWFVYSMAQDVNVACEGDGESTPGLAAFIIFSTLTCGIYAYYWWYKIANRLAANAPRYGLSFQENGTSVLMWFVFAYFTCGISSWIGINIVIKNSNLICDAYNQSRGL